MNSVDDLIGHMDRCGIEKAVVCHALARYSHPLFGNEKLLREIAGKILYASDFNWLDPRGHIGRVLGADISVEDKERILYKNANEMFNFTV
ncbi:hypothetical protein ES703_106561 [subsurface metagenome]